MGFCFFQHCRVFLWNTSSNSERYGLVFIYLMVKNWHVTTTFILTLSSWTFFCLEGFILAWNFLRTKIGMAFTEALESILQLWILWLNISYVRNNWGAFIFCVGGLSNGFFKICRRSFRGLSKVDIFPFVAVYF